MRTPVLHPLDAREPVAGGVWRAALTDRGSPLNSEVFRGAATFVSVAVIDWPTGTVLFATKSFIEEVPLMLVFTRMSHTKVLPSPVSRGLE